MINAILYLGAAAGALLVGRPFMVNYGHLIRNRHPFPGQHTVKSAVFQGSRVQLIISETWPSLQSPIGGACEDVFFMAGGVFGGGAIGTKCLLLSRLLSGFGLGISASCLEF